MIRVLPLSGSHRGIGRVHGETHAGEIRDYAAGRVELARTGTGLSADQVLEIVAETIPHHRDYSADLMEETEALAEAVGLSLAEAILVSGYTDILDTVSAAVAEDDCTAVIVPDSAAEGAGFFAQTWDMNASATPHVVMLDLAPVGKPRALVFTTVGCVGQLGMNEFGVCVGINNLTVTDGRPGVTWPFVVRKALEQTGARQALEAVLAAELAGGHNFHIFDRQGVGFSVEATATRKVVVELSHDEGIVRTNHCLATVTGELQGPRPAALHLSSETRLADATDHLARRPVTVESLMAMTRDEGSICRRPEPPLNYETCGAAIMRPVTGEMWAVWGIPADNPYEQFRLPVTVGT